MKKRNSKTIKKQIMTSLDEVHEHSASLKKDYNIYKAIYIFVKEMISELWWAVLTLSALVFSEYYLSDVYKIKDAVDFFMMRVIFIPVIVIAFCAVALVIFSGVSCFFELVIEYVQAIWDYSKDKASK